MANSRKYGVTFFQPGQIIFHVAGYLDKELSQVQMVKKLVEWANNKKADKDSEFQKMQISESKQNPVPFPGSAGDSSDMYRKALLSKKSVQIAPYLPPPYEKRGPFTLFPATVTFTDIPEEEQTNKLLDLVLFLDENRKSAHQDPTYEIPLQVVSPNWLMSAGPSDPGGTGGPGGRPVEYDGEETVTLEHYGFNFDSPVTNARDWVENGMKGEGVVVAVLDTAPVLEGVTNPKDQKILEVIYKNWVTDTDPEHSLLKSLLNKCLEVNYDPDVDNCLQVDEHDYLMSDHGLFVAGIIHSLASKAKIHLFEVLNSYGVGDLMGIARGLKQVIDKFQDENLVVNMSLTMQFPLEEAHIGTDDAKGKNLGMKILDQKRPWYEDLICMIINWFCKKIYDIFHIPLPGCEESWFERQALALLAIIKSLNTLNSHVIAAAGNKRKGSGSYRPRAEYPAAFPGVLGVGALPKCSTPRSPWTRLETASYSNWSDRPRGLGIATLGGEEGVNEKGVNNGILGIYVGTLPGPKDGTGSSKPSTSGWAYWCGTSFATAIMTGMTVNILSNMPGNKPRKAIYKLFKAQRFRTKENEDVLFVTQGPPTP